MVILLLSLAANSIRIFFLSKGFQKTIVLHESKQNLFKSKELYCLSLQNSMCSHNFFLAFDWTSYVHLFGGRRLTLSLEMPEENINYVSYSSHGLLFLEYSSFFFFVLSKTIMFTLF